MSVAELSMRCPAEMMTGIHLEIAEFEAVRVGYPESVADPGREH